MKNKIYKTKDTFINNLNVNSETDCHEWKFYKNVDGYGRMVFNGKVRCAHRVVYELNNGDIPQGLVVRHKCHNPACCNIDHLLLGTQQDNIKDMVDAGRSKSPKRKHKKSKEWKEKISAGIKQYCADKKQSGTPRIQNAKLSEDAVRYIRERAKDGLHPKVIAAEYEMTPNAIRHIIQGKTWSHVR